MISAWIIYDQESASTNNAYIDWFTTEANKQNMNLQLILRENLQIGVINDQPSLLYNHQKVTLPDVAIVRTIDPLLSKQLELLGVQVFNNSEVATICNHKGLTHQHISNLHIPMVDTYFYQKKKLTR